MIGALIQYGDEIVEFGKYAFNLTCVSIAFEFLASCTYQLANLSLTSCKTSNTPPIHKNPCINCSIEIEKIEHPDIYKK